MKQKKRPGYREAFHWFNNLDVKTPEQHKNRQHSDRQIY